MSDYGHMGYAFIGMFRLVVGLLLIAVPLAIWKLVEIVIWICHHVHVGVTP